mgnify:CR=1 FL=1
MIVLLLNYSKNLQAATNDGIPSTGGVECSDSAVIAVPALLIKKANAKMIERKYLLLITNEQDSIINMKDKYINEQQKIITDFQKRIADTNKLNETIKKDLDKQKKRNKIITYSAGGVIIGLVIGLIVK